MVNICRYQSPLGELLLAADEVGLTGLWFEGQKFFANQLGKNCVEEENETLRLAKAWLDDYFAGKEPKQMIPLHPVGTEFQMQVWKILCNIPYGKTITYGEIAREIAERRGIRRMSAQAVGGAVGHNKIGIIIPCHRVIGQDGSLTGYAGGLDKKVALLKIEGVCNSF